MTYEEAYGYLKKLMGCATKTGSEECLYKEYCDNCEYDYDSDKWEDAIATAREALEKILTISQELESIKEDLSEAYKLNDAILSYVLKGNVITEFESRAESFSLRMMQNLDWLIDVVESEEE